MQRRFSNHLKVAAFLALFAGTAAAVWQWQQTKIDALTHHLAQSKHILNLYTELDNKRETHVTLNREHNQLRKTLTLTTVAVRSNSDAHLAKKVDEVKHAIQENAKQRDLLLNRIEQLQKQIARSTNF